MEASTKGQGAAATRPDETVEHRAVGSGRTVRRRGAGEGDVERAESRGAYRDLNGVRRIIGAGQPVPDGWTRIEDASVEDRVDGLEVRGGAEGTSGESAKGRRGGAK